jgi:hypothetical protein
MQYANSTLGRQAKKHKYPVDKASTSGDLTKASNSDESGSNEPASNKPASDDPTTNSDRPSKASNILKPHKADVTTSARPI